MDQGARKNVGFFLLPLPRPGHSSVHRLMGWDVAITAKSKNPDAARRSSTS